MTNMKIKVKHEGADQYFTISLPTDASLLPVKRLLKVMIHKLDFPTQKQNGSPIAYKLYHEQTRKALSDNQTLKDAGVVENDTFEILIASESGDIAKNAAVSKQRTKKDDQSNEKPDVKKRQLPGKPIEKTGFQWNLLLRWVLALAAGGAVGEVLV
ncbi:MAG: hypothetical protein GY774_13630 [Planctomycetes bacterium]|nr:hypothetical protein [Planctomycetota bacterium]